MNKRRWVAVGIFGVVVVGSILVSVMGSSDDQTEKNKLTTVQSILYGSNELAENQLEPGVVDKRIVKVTIDGTIADTGESSGLFSNEGYNHAFVLQQLQAIQEDDSIKAVLLEVNSPGGGVYESAELARQIHLIQDKKKALYVSMQSMAASGGYYISASADKIFATDETITGSIGVISSSLNYAGLLEKLGLKEQTYKSGALKDMNAPTKEPSEEEKNVMQDYINSSYERFVDIVATGRKLPKETVYKLADGRIYDGSQAVKNGLVDEIGYEDQALTALRKDKNLKHAQVFEYGTSSTGFAQTFFGAKLAQWQGLTQSPETRLTKVIESIGTQSAPKPMYMYGGE